MPLQSDSTGNSVNNLIQGEVQPLPLSIATFPYVFLANGPFFGKNLTVVYNPAAGGTSTTLVLGTDYTTSFMFNGYGTTQATQVWGAVQLLNTGLAGTITVGYQALGGATSANAVSSAIGSTPATTTSSSAAGVLRFPTNIPLLPNTNGATAGNALDIRITNTHAWVAMTVGGATLLPQQFIQFSARNNDTLAPLSWAVPVGGSGALLQLA